MPRASTKPHSDTRERLLQTALQAFGHRDYDAVSTREIVEAAEANISAISYHFGGKRSLYLATAAYLADNLYASQRARIEQVNAETGNADRVRCRVLLRELIGGFATSLLTGKFGEDAPGFIFREQNHPTDAFDILYAKLLEPMHSAVTGLVARIRGLPPKDPEAKVVAHALLGQVVAFRAGRTTMLKHLGKRAYGAKEVKMITRLVASLANHALDY